MLAGFLGKIFVDCQQERPEAGSARQIVIHGRVLRSCDKLRSTPLGELDQVIRLFEGNFLASLSDLAQESRNSHRLPCPRSIKLRSSLLTASAWQRSLNSQVGQWSLKIINGGEVDSICFLSLSRLGRASLTSRVAPLGPTSLIFDTEKAGP